MRTNMVLFTVVGLIFVVLQLIGSIDWSWWLVLLPFYGPWALLIALLLAMGADNIRVSGRINNRW